MQEAIFVQMERSDGGGLVMVNPLQVSYLQPEVYTVGDCEDMPATMVVLAGIESGPTVKGPMAEVAKILEDAARRLEVIQGGA